MSWVQQFCLCSLLLAGWTIYGQQPALKFTHYGKEDGLNQSSVNAIYQDHQGLLWIANFGGINSFDGYTFQSYVHQFKDSTSIPDNSVWDILEDRQNRLWFGTKSSLSLYDRQRKIFRNFYIRKPGVNTLAVKSIFQTKDGRLLVGSEGQGLYLFDDTSNQFVFQEQFPLEIKVTSITEDHRGTLWVGTEGDGLYAWDGGVMHHFQIESGMDLSTIWSLYCDDQGQLWIGTDVEGLLSWDHDEQNFIRLSETHESYNCGFKIKSITADSQGILWIGSATHGLSIFDKTQGRFSSYNSLRGQNNTLYDNDVSDIFIGQNGVIWVGMYMNGFDKVVKTPFQTLRHNPNEANTLSNNNVYCMYRDSQGILWMGTFGGGLNRFDAESQTFTHYRHDPANPQTISHDWVRILYEDRSGNFWVGTWGGGLNKFDRDSGTFKRYLPDPESPENSLNLNIITAVHQDSRGNLWVGTYGAGINMYQPQSDDFISLRHNDDDSTSLSDDHITSFYEDSQGNLWVCTYGGGLNRYDHQTGIFHRFIPDESEEYSLNNHKVLHIFPEPDSSHWWITTLGGGINKFYPEDHKFQGYTINQGLADNTTMGMLRDNHGYWISTNTGLSYFDLEDYSFTNYTTADGLASDDFNLEAYTIHQGLFYFGSKQGVTYFNPQQIRDESFFPQVRVMDVKINSSPIFFETDNEIQVPYNQRVSFEFAAINPSKVENIQYAYMLEGLDQDWQYVGKQRLAEFASLPPGQYTMKVKSTNGSNLWSDNYYALSIDIPPPWYMTWYFRMGAVLMIILLGAGYYIAKVTSLRKQKRSLEEQVVARTKTIAQKNLDLKESYQKLKNLESFKESLVHMIAHDLKNPLVTILGTSELHAQDKHMVQIHKSGTNMLMLIENMLDVQKFQQEKMVLNLGKVSLSDTVNRTFEELVLSANQKNIVLRNLVEPNIMVEVDHELLERVILNLLTNALKFSYFGSNIDVGASVIGDRVEVRVRDYGEGIDKEVQKAIFEKYVQEKVRQHGRSKSTGLGLAFCQLAIQAHGGNINVESKPKEGSTFIFDVALSGLEEVPNNIIKTQVSVSPIALSDQDLELLYRSKQQIETLEVYQMGEWLELLDKIKETDSPAITNWCQQIEHVLARSDAQGLETIKDRLRVHWSKLSQS